MYVQVQGGDSRRCRQICLHAADWNFRNSMHSFARSLCVLGLIRFGHLRGENELCRHHVRYRSVDWSTSRPTAYNRIEPHTFSIHHAPEERIDKLAQGLILEDEAQERGEVEPQQPPELGVRSAGAGAAAERRRVILREKGHKPKGSRSALLAQPLPAHWPSRHRQYGAFVQSPAVVSPPAPASCPLFSITKMALLVKRHENIMRTNYGGTFQSRSPPKGALICKFLKRAAP